MSAPHILVVDDENDIRSTIKEILTEEGYEVDVASDASEASAQLRRQHPDLIFLDIWMPDTDGITLLKQWSEVGEPQCPVVILSGHGTVETAMEATRLGAVDFIEKPLSLAKLLRTVETALSARPGAPVRRAEVGAPGTALLGRSRAMRELRERALATAGRPDPVLIVGEPGSGRAALAEYLHSLSERAAEPFVSLAGGSLTDANAAALLLGVDEEAGYLERARGGTLYIRNLTDLGMAAQTLLAGVFEQGSFARIGRAQLLKLDVRLLASVAGDPATGDDRLHPDLVAYLGAVRLRLPPLREHAEDLPELLRNLVDRLVETEGLGYRRFGIAAQNRLRHYPWPGNLRELETIVRQLLIAGGPEQVALEELEQQLRPPRGGQREPLVKQDLLALPLRAAREEFERAYLTEHLALCGGRVGQLAKRVGMERTHLYRKLRSLGVDIRQSAEEDS